MNDLECPYCDAPNEVCHDDGQGYEEGKAHEMTCGDCGKNFVFQTSISFYYSPEKADCLNGSPHRFGEWRKIWLNAKMEEIQDRRCKDCDHTERRTVPTSPASDDATCSPRELAIQIADGLFRNVFGDEGSRLEIKRSLKPGFNEKSLGGWGWAAAVDQIAKVIEENVKEHPTEEAK